MGIQIGLVQYSIPKVKEGLASGLGRPHIGGWESWWHSKVAKACTFNQRIGIVYCSFLWPQPSMAGFHAPYSIHSKWVGGLAFRHVDTKVNSDCDYVRVV